jgi:hypothetical protein
MLVDSPVTEEKPGTPPSMLASARSADLRREGGTELFVGEAARPLPPRKVGLAIVAVLSGTVVSLARTRGPGSFNTIWAEDGSFFLSDAYNARFVDVVGIPVNGYWVIGSRILAEFASQFPVRWSVGVMAVEAASMASLLALFVYVASGPHLRHPALRLLAAVPVALGWVGVGYVENNVATLQFPLVYALFWALLWVPATRWGKLAAIVVVLVAAFNTPLVIVFAPLALARLVMRRDWFTASLFTTLSAGIALQFGGLALGWSTRTIGTRRYSPIWAVEDYLSKVPATALFGEKWTFDRITQGVCPQFIVTHTGEHRGLVVLSWVVLAAVVAVGVRVGRPAWTLAALAAVHSIALYCTSIMTLGCTASRYFFAPALLLLAGMAAMLRPRAETASTGTPPATGNGALTQTGRLSAAALALITLTAVVCAANLRTDTPRSMYGDRFSDQLQAAREQCRNPNTPFSVIFTEGLWSMTINCDVLDPARK